MTVITPPAIDLSAPPVDPIDGDRRYWDPTSIHDTVFPEPARRELAVAESAVRQFQDRVVEEIRWLHEIINELETRITELETGGAVELKASAIAETTHIIRRARVNADRHMAEAHHKIERMQADALRRIAAAERAVTPDVEPTALPPLDARDLAGSMRRRVDYVRKLNAEIRADARLMTEAAGLADDLDRPYEPEQTPEPEQAPEPTALTGKVLVNESGENQTIRTHRGLVTARPGDSVYFSPISLSDEDRVKLASPGLDWDRFEPNPVVDQIISEERERVPEEHHDDHEAAEAEQAHDAESVDDAPH